jgi:hypothetical protein
LNGKKGRLKTRWCFQTAFLYGGIIPNAAVFVIRLATFAL